MFDGPGCAFPLWKLIPDMEECQEIIKLMVVKLSSCQVEGSWNWGTPKSSDRKLDFPL